MHARVVLGVGKGVLFREVSSVQECPYKEVALYVETNVFLKLFQLLLDHTLVLWAGKWTQFRRNSRHLVTIPAEPRTHTHIHKHTHTHTQHTRGDNDKSKSSGLITHSW